MNDVLQVNPGNGAGPGGPGPLGPGPGGTRPSLGRFGVASPEQVRLDREPPPPPSQRRRRRRWPWVVSGVAVAGALGAGSFILGQAIKPVPPRPAPPPPPPATAGVVALAQAVTQGQALSLSDLTVITVVTGPGAGKGSPPPSAKLPYFPASMEASLIGRHARSALPAGALLKPGELTDNPFPAQGQALVGMDLQPSEAPTGGALLPGDEVGVLFVPAASQPPYPAPKPVVTGRVVASVPGQSGDSDVTVLVPAGVAARVAAYAQHNEVALVRLGPGVQWPPRATLTTVPAPTTTTPTTTTPTTTAPPTTTAIHHRGRRGRMAGAGGKPASRH
jgi:hypothetical protein